MDDLERQRRKRAEREQYDRAATQHPTGFRVIAPAGTTIQVTMSTSGPVAQHTWTPGCDGFHPPGVCP
jgi:hypothetical protein